MDVAGAFAKTSHRLPEKPMLVFKNKSYTFQEMDALSDRLAGGLSSLGMRQGDVISIGLPNGPEIIITLLAAAKLGAVVVPLNTMLKEKELGYVFQDCPIKVAVTFRSHAEIISRLNRQGIDAPRLVVVGEGEAPDWFSYDALTRQDSLRFAHAPMKDDDVFLIVYTSGTTGEPKGVMLTHGNVLSVARAVASFQRQSEKDSWVCFFPLTHITGIVNFIIGGFSTGSTMILQERFEVNDYLESFVLHRCSIMGAVNAVFQTILASPKLDDSDLRSLRLITSGGASLPVELYRRLKERFRVPILEMYGMTENAATLTSNPLETQKEGSVGLSLPGMEVRVEDEEGRDLPVGEVGEILARGPGIMKGYYNKPDLTAKALRAGWYHTGDLGRMDEDGFLYIVDRKDDMINAGAFKIYPREIEEVLYTHPAVQDCAVKGVPDERLGQVPVAFVVVKEGQAVIREELEALCRDRIANYKVPRRFHFTSELPRAAQGKVMKRLLVENFGSS
jgi:long-chain acyl-CoA synthetase